MAFMCEEYPSWKEIKCEVSKTDLLDIISAAQDVGIDQAIEDYIKENYEAVLVPDIDAAYEAARDDRFTEES